MDAEKLLEEAGLTKNEAKVYLALLGFGQTTTSPLIKKVGINTSKVYESLERLLKKGLVSFAIIKNKKHWYAEEPSRLIALLKEQKALVDKKIQRVSEILPALQEKRKLKESFSQYTVFEGLRGIKTAREKVLDVLKKGDTFYLILSAYPEEKKLEAYWLDFQKRRARKGIRCKYLINEMFKEFGKKREKIPFTKTKYVKSEILSPTWIEIYANFVGIGVLSPVPAMFLIKNERVAEGFLAYFESLWRIAKP